ncbi:MAG: glycosyltransferase family 4 protein [Gemmataceae bacterium]
MRLICLVSSPDHVCARYRFSAFKPMLESAGHSLELVPLPPAWWARLMLFRKLRGEAVVVQRHLMPVWQLTLLRRWAGSLLYDLDDAVWLRDSYSRHGLHHPRKLTRFAAAVRACDAVVAGNDFLAEQVARLGGTPVVIPTCVDPAKYAPAEGDGKTLVWVGSSSTLQGLERIASLLDGVGRAVPGVKLKVVCDRFPEFRDLPVVSVPWSEATEAAEIASAGVGIAWIPDDDWSRGKCGLKVLQYMAAGLPVIANPVGVHPAMVRHGATGLLASTPYEWIDAVTRLVKDTDLRRRMGRIGRARVESEYGVAEGARRWADLLGRVKLRRRAA